MCKFFSFVIILISILAPSHTEALTLQEQITKIQTDIAILQAQLTILQPTPSTSSTFSKDLRMLNQDPEVTQLQKILKSEGLFCKSCKVTGYFGYWTKVALMNFQQRYKLKITGILDSQTRAKLNELKGADPAPQPSPAPAPSPSPTPPLSPAPTPPATPAKDTTPPSVTVTINGGAQSTNDPNAILAVTCTDSGGVDAVRYSNLETFTHEPWVGISDGFKWTLSSGDSLKTVYVQCRDKAGNTAIGSDTITLDANPPIRSNGQPSGVITASNEKTLTLTTSEPATCKYSLVQGTDYDAMNDGSKFSTSPTTSHSVVVSTTSNGAYVFAVRCKDVMGNINKDDFLITFTIGSPASTTYNMNVLVLKYFPLTPDKNNIDISVTGDVEESYSTIWQKTTDLTNNLKTVLEKSSTYLGYKDSNAKPALTYTILDIKRYEEAVPTTNVPVLRYPDYQKILERENICSYVDAQHVKEVWLFAYQGPATQDGAPFLNISESKMAGPNGDISNSPRYNDMPLCKKTYRVYTFNYGQNTAEALESWGHQMEAELQEVDPTLLSIFQGPPHPQASKFVGRCGSVHNPPNARTEYDRENSISQESDCLDWKPDSIGARSQISCILWGCKDLGEMDNPSLNYIIWNLQNLPGRLNTKTYKEKSLRNWWDIHGDFDEIIKNSKRLTLE